MAAKYLKDPVRISVGAQTQPVEKIDQQIIYTTEHHKPEELEGELNSRQGSVLVFARTQHRVDNIADRLKVSGFKVTRIHGGRTQGQRRLAIEHFRAGQYRILVATDIAARGWISTISPMSSITTCRGTRKITSTASGAPLGPGPRGTRFAF